MSSPRDTSKFNTADALLFFAEAMGEGGTSGAIERQEEQGQRELVNSTVLPTKFNSGSEADLVALGFTFGEQVEGDRLFRHVELPAGWKREGSDHAMWSYLVDEQGRRRCSIFYKAAFYDRDAFINVASVYGYLTECLYEDKTPVLDDSWVTREALLEALEKVRQVEQERVDLWTGRPEPYAVEYEAESRDKLTKIEALRSSLAEQTPGGAE